MPLKSRSPLEADACALCLSGMHAMCDQDPCCCAEQADVETLFRHLDVAERALLQDLAREYGIGASGAEFDDEISLAAATAPVKQKGDSGYIHPDAWVGTENIGTLADPLSTGRKRQARMYPISVGTTCEWAGKVVSLGDLPEIVGCMNAAATDLHHGPDKNTLNNEKASTGRGQTENTHVICSECHNLLHARHNAFYPEYDRVAQQAEPWMPKHVEYGTQYTFREASIEELVVEEARRREAAAKTDKKRGRKARSPKEGDFSVE